VCLCTVSAHLRLNPQVFLLGQYPALVLHLPQY
jgi:hypothetical protein